MLNLHLNTRSFTFGAVLLFSVLFLFIVMPNALRPVKLVLLGLLLLTAVFKKFKFYREQFFLIIIGTLVTVIYIMIGSSKSLLPETAATQALTVYIVFPILWILISNYILSYYSSETIVRKYLLLIILGSISVYLAIYAYNNGMKDYVSILIENPNASFADGQYAITLNVYGSLLFAYGGFGFLSSIYSRFKYLIMFLVFFSVALISGRSALILAIVLGGMFFVFANRKRIGNLFSLALIFGPLLIFSLSYFGIDVGKSVEAMFNEVQEAGGSERSGQFSALLDGIFDNYFLGSGHGVGVSFLRNENYPWRYEILPLSVIFRVGILGFLIYALPFFYTVRRYYMLKQKRALNSYDHFFFWGNVVFIVANFTNPYMESFEFQIPFFFTYCYFTFRIKNYKNEYLVPN